MKKKMKKEWRIIATTQLTSNTILELLGGLNGPVKKSSIRTGSTRWNQTHFYAVSGFPRGMGAIDSVIHGPHQLFGVLRNGPNLPPEWTNHIGHCSHFSGWEPVIVGCRLFSFSAHNLSREFFFCASGLATFFPLLTSLFSRFRAFTLAQMLLHIRFSFCDV